MTTLEAYDYTMGVVEEFRNAGVKVECVPPKRAVKLLEDTKNGTLSDEDKAFLEKYSGPERIPLEKWRRVTFIGADLAEVAGRMKSLGWMGATFDCGGGGGKIDWELDWSFAYREREIDSDREEAQEVLTDLLGQMNDGTLLGDQSKLPGSQFDGFGPM